MNIKECPVPIYGDTKYRGKCPSEGMEQMSFFNRIRREFPTSYGLIALHPRNEGLKIGGQLAAVIKHKAEGMTKGAADIIVPGCPTFICEMKRQDHSQSKWQDGQREYLEASQEAGAFACVALGASAAWDAFNHWMRLQQGWME